MKGKMSKKARVILAVIGIAVFATVGVTLAAVSHHKPLISLNKSVLELDVTDTYELEAKVEKAWTKPKWSSEDKSIATVSEDGVVTAVKEGRTKVTITSGKTVVDCEVVVTDSQSAPRIELDFNNVAIGLDYTFTVTPKMMWKGEEVTDEISYTWELNEDAADDIASMKQEGSSAVITGLKYGDTSFKVSATYRDTVLVQTINVCVTNIDVMYESPNMIMSDGCFRVNLGLVETEKDVTSIVPIIRVYDKEKLVKNPKFTWTNSDETIAVRDDIGRITAKQAGDTEITGLYGDSPLLIRVHVYRPEIEIDPLYVEAFKNFAITSSKLSDKVVESVTFSEKEVMKGDPKKGPTVQLDEEKLPAIGTSGRLVIQTEKVKYVSDSMVVSMAIYNESDLNRMPSVIRKNKGEGYYAVAQDITCSGKYDSKLDVEFVGTFDGCGNTIKNMTTSDREGCNRGLLGNSLGGDGVVKNISFTKAKHGGQGAFIVNTAAGKMENVYVQIAITDCSVDGGEGATSVLASNTYGVFQTKSVIVEYMNDLPEDTTTGYALWQMYYGYAKHQGFYVIGTDKNANGEEKLDGGLKDIYGAYVNYGEFVDAGNDVSTWDEDFWNITNGIPYPKNLGTRATDAPKVTLPKYVGTGTSVKLDGLTVCDRVIRNSTMTRYGIKIQKGYLVIPKNVPSGTVLNITIQSAFDASKKTTVKTTVLKSEQVTMTTVTAVELNNAKKFDVVLKAEAKRLAGAKLIDVTINGEAVDKVSFKSNKITLRTSCLDGLGEKTLLAYFKKGSKLIIITATVDACTMAIENEADLNRMASVIHKNKGEGRYVLANNIKCKGTYDANISDEFNGTFEGHGYTIYNMTTSSRDGANRGLLGASLGQRGVVRNTSFVNAKHSGKGAFIVSTAAGTMENLYVQISVDKCSVDGYEGATSVLASATYGVFSTRNVIVEYVNRLPSGAQTGHAIWQLYYGYEKHQGLYVIGEDRVATQAEDLGGGLKDTYGAYLNYGEYIKANISTKIWDSSFWKVTNNVPYPKRLGASTGSVPKVTLPTYVGMNSKVKLDGLTVCDEVVENKTMKQYGIKVKDGYLIIPKNVPSKTTLNIVIRSAFNHSKKTTVRTTIMSSTKTTIKKLYAVELDGAKTFNLDLNGENSAFKKGTLVDVTIAGKKAKISKYANNIITLQKADVDGLGEKTVEAYFKVDNRLVIATMTLDACTLAIENEADLNNMASVIHKNKGEGRYILANNITCQGTYDANISDEFNGTFEGHGYTIYNMTTSSRDGADRGLLGASLGQKGVVKNTSFVNAKHSGKGAFIVSAAAGTMENLYVQIAVDNCSVDGYEGATSVLASATYGVFSTRNVVVEYMNRLPSGAKTGHAIWQLYYGYAKHQGLYVIGEDKVATQTENLGGGLKDTYGAYLNYGEYIKANISTKIWDSSFWNVTNNVPYPKRLGARTGSVPNVTLPTYVGMDSKVKLDGLTVCDEVVENETMKQYGIKVKDGYLIIPKNVPSGTTLNIVIRSAFNHSKKTTVRTAVMSSSKTTVKKIYAVELDGAETFDLNLDGENSAFKNGTLVDVTIAGKKAETSNYANDILTLQKADIDGLGEQTVEAYFEVDNRLVIATITIDACTLAIENEADLNHVPTVIHENGGAGRYVLANDITCYGTYDANISDEFNGTFEGHGYVIYNMKTSNRTDTNRGLLGASLGSKGIVRNVSFVNAKHGGQGAFIATSAAGTLENVYIQIAITDYNTNSYEWATSVLASSTFGVFSTKNVVVEYMNPLPDGASTGYALWQLHYGYAKHQGLYVIGAGKAASQETDLGGGATDIYAAHKTYGDFVNANHDLSGWNNDFWTVKYNVPVPKRLDFATVPEVSIPETVEQNSETEITGLNLRETVILADAFTALGIKVEGNKLIVPENVPADTEIELKVQNIFDTAKVATLSTKVVAPSGELKKISWTDFNGISFEQHIKGTADVDYGYSGTSLNNTSFEGDIKLAEGTGFRYGGAAPHYFGMAIKVVNGKLEIIGHDYALLNGEKGTLYTCKAADYEVGDTFAGTRFTLRIDMYDISDDNLTAKSRIYVNGIQVGEEITIQASDIAWTTKIGSHLGAGNGLDADFWTYKTVPALTRLTWTDFAGIRFGQNIKGDADVDYGYSGDSLNNTSFEGDIKLAEGTGFRYGGAAPHYFGMALKVVNGKLQIIGHDYALLNGVNSTLYTCKAADYEVGDTFADTRFTLRIDMYDISEDNLTAKSRIFVNGKQVGEEITIQASDVAATTKIGSHLGAGNGLGADFWTYKTVPELTKITWTDFTGISFGQNIKGTADVDYGYSGTSLNNTSFEGDIKLAEGTGFRYGGAAPHYFGMAIKVVDGKLQIVGHDYALLNGVNSTLYTCKAADYGVGSTFAGTRFTLRIDTYDISDDNLTAKSRIYVNGKQVGEEITIQASDVAPTTYLGSHLGAGNGLDADFWTYKSSSSLTKITWTDFNGISFEQNIKGTADVDYGYSGDSLNNTSFEGDIQIAEGTGFRYGGAAPHYFGMALKVVDGKLQIIGHDYALLNGVNGTLYTCDAADYEVGDTFADTRFTLRIDMYDISDDNLTAKSKIYVNGKLIGEEITIQASDIAWTTKIGSHLGAGNGLSADFWAYKK